MLLKLLEYSTVSEIFLFLQLSSNTFRVYGHLLYRHQLLFELLLSNVSATSLHAPGVDHPVDPHHHRNRSTHLSRYRCWCRRQGPRRRRGPAGERRGGQTGKDRSTERQAQG